MEPQAGFEPAASSLPRMRSNQSELLGPLWCSPPLEHEIKFSPCTLIGLVILCTKTGNKAMKKRDPLLISM